MPWEKVDVTWGDTAQEPAVDAACPAAARPRTRIRARRTRPPPTRSTRLQEIAREDARRQARAVPRRQRARLGRRRQHDAGAGGAEGHRAGRQVRRPRAAREHQRVHDSVGDGAGRPGADGRGARHLPARRRDAFLRRRLRRSRSRRRDRQVPHRSTTSRSPTSAPSSTRARSAARCSAARCSASATRSARRLGLRPALRRCRWRSGSTRTSRRPSSTCRSKMQWDALDIPDPETPVGARGIGEPPVGRRLPAPSSTRSPTRSATTCSSARRCTARHAADGASKHGRPMQEPLPPTSRGTEDAMAVIRDVMPAFELFQPASVDDALELLDAHGAEAWVLAGGMDCFDWLKDRTQAAAGRRRPQPGDRAARHPGGRRRPRDRRDDDAHRGGRASGRAREVLDPAAEAAELVASPQIRNQGTHRRQRVAGHALLVLPRRLDLLPRRRQHLLRRHADRHQPRARDSSTPTAASRSTRRTRRRRWSRSTRRWSSAGRSGERVVNAEDYFIGPDIDITRMTVLAAGRAADRRSASRRRGRARSSTSRRCATGRCGTSRWSTSRRRSRPTATPSATCASSSTRWRRRRSA